MTDPAPSTEALDGRQLREMFAAATAWLDVNSEQVNAVNVFPVPDGDTGTNMLLTMRSTMREADNCQDEGAGAMLAAMSHGALMGARGNSGVILSQIVSGMAGAIGTAEHIEPRIVEPSPLSAHPPRGKSPRRSNILRSPPRTSSAYLGMRKMYR